MLKKITISTFWLDVFGEMVNGAGAGLIALQSLLSIEKGTNPFQF